MVSAERASRTWKSLSVWESAVQGGNLHRLSKLQLDVRSRERGKAKSTEGCVGVGGPFEPDPALQKGDQDQIKLLPWLQNLAEF